jgi:hypothetical protein
MRCVHLHMVRVNRLSLNALLNLHLAVCCVCTPYVHHSYVHHPQERERLTHTRGVASCVWLRSLILYSVSILCLSMIKEEPLVGAFIIYLRIPLVGVCNICVFYLLIFVCMQYLHIGLHVMGKSVRM